jgi:NAD(P)-dependent dehydrogenase (short-subunit alcohol dehydrogenase family)
MMVSIPAAIPRVALVTGAARRLGRSIALALAEAGFDLALHCHTRCGEAEGLCEQIQTLGRKATIVSADFRCEDQLATVLPQAVSGLGPVGVLVNNAGSFLRDEWHDATRESWDHHMQPNLRAPFVLMQDFARLLPQAAQGVVVNMLDERVWSPTPHFMTYTVSKAGLWMLTQTMALALAPRIRVCAIGPGATLPSPQQTPAQLARHIATTPLGHGATPEEIGRAVLMVLSLPAFTGQMIALDGGQHLQWSPARS